MIFPLVACFVERRLTTTWLHGSSQIGSPPAVRLTDRRLIVNTGASACMIGLVYRVVQDGRTTGRPSTYRARGGWLVPVSPLISVDTVRQGQVRVPPSTAKKCITMKMDSMHKL